MTSIYLIRHGQALGNVARVFQGQTDHPLTQEGHRQAQLLASRFVSVPLHAVYASPLARARQTAEPLARLKGVEVQVDPGLIEMHFGDMENSSYDQVEDRFGDQVDLLNNQPHLFAGTGEAAESMQEVHDRMVSAFYRLVGQNPGRNIAAVSHGCAMRTLLCHCHGYPISRLYDVGASNNTAVSHITVHESGRLMVHRVGDDSHLGTDSRTLAQRAVRR